MPKQLCDVCSGFGCPTCFGAGQVEVSGQEIANIPGIGDVVGGFCQKCNGKFADKPKDGTIQCPLCYTKVPVCNPKRVVFDDCRKLALDVLERNYKHLSGPSDGDPEPAEPPIRMTSDQWKRVRSTLTGISGDARFTFGNPEPNEHLCGIPVELTDAKD